LQVAGESLGFEEGLRHVVGLGGDTDTNAAVAGALLGALHGVASIPDAWLGTLADREAIEQEASALADLVGSATGSRPTAHPPSGDGL
jgi:ADP-ribosylglycohydrolase